MPRMADFTFDLPWPGKALSPNSRPHWSAKHKAAQASKNAAWGIVRLAVKKRLPWPRVVIEWVFHPKTAHAVDLDNLIGSAKYLQDGIALAIGIDDSLFDPTYRIGEPVKGGLVRVSISKPEFKPL